MSEKSFFKPLRVLNILAENTALSQAEIVDISGFTQSSVYRICKQLEEFGWLTKRISDGRFLLASQMQENLENASYEPFEVTDLKDFLIELAQEGDFDARLNILSVPGRIDCVECSRSNRPREEVDFIDAPEALVIQRHLTITKLRRNLKAHFERSYGEADASLAINKRLDEVHAIKMADFYLDIVPGEFFKAIEYSNGSVGCLRVSMKKFTKSSYIKLADHSQSWSDRIDSLTGSTPLQRKVQ